MKGRIGQGGAAAYDSPVPGRGDELLHLAPGTEIEVLESYGDFYAVKVLGRSEPAYVHRLDVDIVPEPPDSPREMHPESATSARRRYRKAEMSGAEPLDEVALDEVAHRSARAIVTLLNIFGWLLLIGGSIGSFAFGLNLETCESVGYRLECDDRTGEGLLIGVAGTVSSLLTALILWSLSEIVAFLGDILEELSAQRRAP